MGDSTAQHLLIALPAGLHLASRVIFAEVKVKVEYAVELPLKQKQHDMTKYRAAVKAAVARAAGPVAAAWQKAGGTVVWQSGSAPIMHVKARGSVISAAKDIPGMVHAKEYQAFTPVHQAATSTTDLNLPTVFYANNQYGEGVRVGISEEQYWSGAADSASITCCTRAFSRLSPSSICFISSLKDPP